jgi:hypothetical protein
MKEGGERKMRRSVVIGGIALAMRAMAKKSGITLHIGGDTACTNGTTIIIPNLPDDNKVMGIKARGYVDHESGHVAHTDFSILNSKWLNILEDVRIEKAHSRWYPGVAVNTRELVTLLVKEGEFKTEADDPMGMLMMWALSRTRHRILGQDAIALREAEVEPYCRQLFGDKFSNSFVAIVDRVEKATSTADCQKLVDEIEKLINQSASAAPQPGQPDGSAQGSPQSDGSDKGTGQSGQQPDQPAGSGKGQESDQTDQQPGQNPTQTESPDQNPTQTGSSNQGAGQEPGKSGDSGQESGQPDSSGGGKGAGSELKGLRSLLGAEPMVETDLGTILRGQLEIAGQKTAGEAFPPPTTKPTLVKQSDSEFRKFKDDTVTALQKSGKLRSQLSGLFQAQYQRHGFSVQNGLRLNKGTVHLIAVNTPDKRVFTAHQERKQENTAIQLLLDSSGSMKGPTMSLASNSAYAAATCIEMMKGVICGVGAFPGEDNSILEVKAFGVKPDLRKFFAVYASGGTPIAEAVLWGGQQLSLRRENRKMIILFTDGAPDQIPEVREAIKKVMKYGIELYVVAMGNDPEQLLDYTSKWVDRSLISPITKIDELGAAFIKLLRKTLIHKKAE